MAVYTKINQKEINIIYKNFNIDKLIRFKGILKAAHDLAILPVFCGILGSKRATSNFKLVFQYLFHLF